MYLQILCQDDFMSLNLLVQKTKVKINVMFISNRIFSSLDQMVVEALPTVHAIMHGKIIPSSGKHHIILLI